MDNVTGMPAKNSGELAWQANAEMETRMLEEQLEHARKDIVALKRKQEFQLPGGAMNAAALHAAKVPPWFCAKL